MPRQPRYKRTDLYSYTDDSKAFLKRYPESRNEVEELISSSATLTRHDFLDAVGGHPQVYRLEKQLDYALHYKAGKTMISDLTVTYHRGELFGEKTYYVYKNGIAYLFTKTGKRL